MELLAIPLLTFVCACGHCVQFLMDWLDANTDDDLRGAQLVSGSNGTVLYPPPVGDAVDVDDVTLRDVGVIGRCVLHLRMPPSAK